MLQEFAWTEKDRIDRLEMRNRTLQALGFDAIHQPMFNFESTIKAFYFSALIYQYEDVRQSFWNTNLLHHYIFTNELLVSPRNQPVWSLIKLLCLLSHNFECQQ